MQAGTMNKKEFNAFISISIIGLETLLNSLFKCSIVRYSFYERPNSNIKSKIVKYALLSARIGN